MRYYFSLRQVRRYLENKIADLQQFCDDIPDDKIDNYLYLFEEIFLFKSALYYLEGQNAINTDY